MAKHIITEEDFLHVDEFVECYSADEMERYAKWVLMYFRYPAIMKSMFDSFMEDHKLFCNYEGKRYRVTGASRLGDIWLSENFERTSGYELRVFVDKCSGWGKRP